MDYDFRMHRGRTHAPAHRAGALRARQAWTPRLARAAGLGLVLGLALQAPDAQAQDERWLMRLRAVSLHSVNHDNTGLDLSVSDKVLPEVDFSYFFTPQIAAELVLTYPQRHNLRAGGNLIGSLRELPPTLLLQYHFTDLGRFKPYVGAGINYTRFSSVKFSEPVQGALGPSIDHHSFGPALQVGLDFEVARNTYLNVDVKKVWISTDVRSFGDKVGTFKVDPWLVGIGIGRRF